MKKVWKKILTGILFLSAICLYISAVWQDNGKQSNRTEKEEIIIAVLDTGYTGNHARVKEGAAFIGDEPENTEDGNGHGTRITEIVLDMTPEKVKIIPVKIADYKGCATEMAAYDGISYAIEQKADMILMPLNMSGLDENSSLAAMVSKAVSSGIDVVVSAGNSAKNTKDVFPANIAGVVAVSAVDENDVFCDYSNYGTEVDFAAYGTYLGERGTSYAAARVAAILADEYISGGNIKTLRSKVSDAGEAGKDDYYGYGILHGIEAVASEIQKETFIGKTEHDIGHRILELDWKNTDAELLNNYFAETHKAYVGMYLSRLDETERAQLAEEVAVLKTDVLVQVFEADEDESSIREINAYEEGFIENAIKTYREYEEELTISDEFLILKNTGQFAVSSSEREDIYLFTIAGFKETVDTSGSPYFKMFDTNRLTVTRTIVKKNTDFGLIYVSGLYPYMDGARSFAGSYINPETGTLVEWDNLYAIDSEAQNGAVTYGLAVTFAGYTPEKTGYHTSEEDIIQIPYAYQHKYSQYSYSAYRQPLSYIFSYYDASTNDTYFSSTPVRVENQAKNFKKLIKTNYKVWYNGVYKDGYDYRNVNAALSRDEKIDRYLKDYKTSTNYDTNILSSQSSVQYGSFTVNFKLYNSMGIEVRNGESPTIAIDNDVPEYNFPLVINTYTIRYHGNGATSGGMADTSMVYNTGKNLSANAYSRAGYIFKGWSTSSSGHAVYSNGQWVNNLTAAHGAVVELYAVWEPVTYTIRYHGNGATVGSMEDTIVKYDIGAALSVNAYSRTGYIFNGWNTRADSSGDTYTDGQWVNNLTAVNGTVIHLYAQWTANTYTIQFHSNGGTGNMDNMAGIYDVPLKLSKNLFARSNDYGPSVFRGWNTDPDVFQALYADEQQVVNLTNIPNSVIDLYAIWDDCPWIIAEDLYYTLEDAQSGRITYAELMHHATAEDREAGGMVSPGIDEEKKTSFLIMDYDNIDFTQFTEDGNAQITYQVIDSIGNEYQKKVTVYIVDSAPKQVLLEGTTRFISEKYYYEPYERGGLEENSIWKTDPEYIAVIKEAFSNSKNDTPEMSFYFTYEEILEMKKFVEENGIGNSKSESALSRFYDKFMAPNRVEK